ncbi:transposase [Mesorhizobium sp. WSM3868]|uniref:transposase n=1 Tax=Mesorhizobium sp. WSM3868 TaxID=2029405 RepID=UPI0032AFA010
MESYKRGGYTVWDCKYHLVWTTKYRYEVLGGDIGNRCRDLLRESAHAHEMKIHAGRSIATMCICWWRSRRVCRLPGRCSI